MYPSFRGEVRLLSLSMMGNHFHVALLQLEGGGAGRLMHAVMTAYVVYFNRKYGKGGEMFDEEIRLRTANGRREQLNVIAYVHENHGDHCHCEFCSHSLYVGASGACAGVDRRRGRAASVRRNRGVSRLVPGPPDPPPSPWDRRVRRCLGYQTA